MLFNSLSFIFLFLPFAVASYRLLVRFAGPRFAVPWLALVSYAFYLFGGSAHPYLLAGSIAINWAGSWLIQRRDGRARKRLLTVFVGLDLLLLAYYKYFGFALEQVHRLGFCSRFNVTIALPVGISFYTFTQIAFLVDAYRGLARERSKSAYALFVTFFPHLIAGPILHHGEMMPQFREPSRTRPWRDVYAGLAMFAIGLAKKAIIADGVAPLASTFFNEVSGASRPGFGVAWIGALAYTAQIYFDFSGYSDMAIGISQMLGIKLPLNFDAPYKSSSIIEFWRRWHITLSRFLRDYLYFSLGGNRKGRARRYLNLFATMVLGGLWHGAGWTFVVWGAIHGLALGIAHAWRESRERLGVPRMPRFFGWAFTFIVVVFAWVPFRAESLSAARATWAGMLGLHGAAIPSFRLFAPVVRLFKLGTVSVSYGANDLALVVGALLVAFLAPTSQQLMSHFELGLGSPGYPAPPSGDHERVAIRVNWRWALAVGILFGIATRFVGGYSEFIYFKF